MRRTLPLLFVLCAACSGEEPDSEPVAVAPSQAAPAPQKVEPAGPRSDTASPASPTEVFPPTADDLERYTADIEGTGALHGDIVTNLGTIHCELFEDAAPMTVANFVGLARGMKPWLDPTSKRVVTERPFYDGLTFHRVVKGFVIQGGDPLGDGRSGPGYQFANEENDLTFDRAGRLGMANAGPDTNGSQFFVTLGAFPHLDGMFTVFGQCDTDTPDTIAGVEVETGAVIHERSRPTSPVVIQTVRFRRK